MTNSNHIFFYDSLDSSMKHNWINYWNDHPHASWRQHPAFGEMSQAGYKICYIVGMQGDQIGLAGIFSYQRTSKLLPTFEAVCMRGPVFNDINFANWCLPRINDYFRALKVGSVRIGPYWKYPDATTIEQSLHSAGFVPTEVSYNNPFGRRPTGVVDIRISAEDLEKSFSSSTRREIKQAVKNSISIKTADSLEDAQTFFNHLDERDRERGILRMSKSEVSIIIPLLLTKRNIGVIISAYYDSTFLGGLLIVRGGSTCFTSKYVVSNDSKRLFPKLRLAPSIFLNGMLWAQSHGCNYCDLEGFTPSANSRSDKEFINRYKEGFNPTACETLGQYRFVINHKIHHFYRLLNKAERFTHIPNRLIYKVLFEAKKRRVHKLENHP